ncbi:diacylglycerol kinase family protein [Streptomyces sp. NPDC058662]|uniref:diacylglycerol kinase family protein n=1 Tax=Streptomyces sp. NPDC058662 TaxID=3346583 RepID=UPI003660ACA0
MKRRSGPAARRTRPLLLLPVQVALVAGLGLLITGPAAGHWPLTEEDRANQHLAQERVAPLTTVTEWFSVLASTEGIISVTLLCVVALLVAPRVAGRAEALFLSASVAAQSAVFLLVTVLVQRPRPDVPRLDGAPPTSSFPSGHVGASVALYGGLAVIVLLRTRGRGPWRYALAAVPLLVPLAVGMSRMYRGMHHPTDVAGGLLNGAATLLIMGFVVLSGREAHPAREAGTGRAPREGAAPAPTSPHPVAKTSPHPDPTTSPYPLAPATADGLGRTVAVVRHPLACPDGLADRIRAVLAAHGHADADQRWLLTTAEQPCGPLAEEIEARRPALVVVCGGDGTLRAVADVLAGTGIPVAVAPCGTGNLLARNLGLPLDPADALAAALAGDCFALDTGRVAGDGITPTRFTVMAGIGFDAAMVRDASPRLKSRLGWPAYVLSALRHLNDPGMRLSIRVDGGRRYRRRARMVVIGNVGALQGGLPLLPRARPDSGRLEVVLFDPRGPFGWLTTAGHLISRIPRGATPPPPDAPAARPGPATASRTPDGRRAAGGALEYFSATRVDIRCASPQPREVDGDVLADGVRLTAEVEPRALRMYLPRVPGAPAATGTDARRAPRPADRPHVPPQPAAPRTAESERGE